MTARDLGADLTAEIRKKGLDPIALAEIETAGVPVRCWSGYGDLAWDDKIFKGTGTFGKISAIEETTELRASGYVFELSGVPAELLEVSLAELRQGKPARVWFAALESGRLVGTPYLIGSGVTDAATIEDNGDTVTIRLAIESRLIDLLRPRIRRLTPADQHLTDPDDAGFDYVAGLADAQIVWGRT